VTPYPGTTRDSIEVQLDLSGYPVTLLDTAGIRAAEDPVEEEGVRRAEARAAAADLVLWVTDATRPAESRFDAPVPRPVWTVRNKIDLLDSDSERPPRPEVHAISALTGAGLDRLVAALTGFVEDTLGAGEPSLVTRERHRAALREAVDALGRAADSGSQEDLIAEELRLAGRALGRLTGRVDVEDVLDVIFRDFCIGK